MLFEWDERKNKVNKCKHGLSFEEAVRVFNDEDAIEVYDRNHSSLEDRYVVIGRITEKTVISVVCTCRDPETMRIISARTANPTEKGEYYESYKKNHIG